MSRTDCASAALAALSRRLSRPAKKAAFVALDATLALTVASILALGAGFDPSWRLAAVAAALGAAASLAAGLHRLKLSAFAPRGLARFAVSAALAGVMLAAVVPSAPAVLHAAWPLAFAAAAVGLRLVLRALLLRAAAAPRRRPVLIWGAGEAGARLAAALHSDPAVRPVAFLDEDPGLHGLVLEGLTVHPPCRADHLARSSGADRVLIALPGAPPRRLAEIAATLAALGLTALAVPDFAEIAGEASPTPGLLPVPAARLIGRTPEPPDLRAARPAYAGRTVLVTGAGGSVGSELCRQLLGLGPRRLVLLDVSEAALHAIAEEIGPEAAARGIALRPVIGSVADRGRVLRLMLAEGVQSVLHAAACKHVPLVEVNPLAGLETNVLGTRAVAEAAQRAGAERFVLVSTDKAVRPAGVMGLSKRLAEAVVQDLARAPRATAMAAVRFGNVLGSSGSVIPRFRAQIARGGPVTLTHEEATRYFMTLAEAARLVLLAGAFARPGRADIFALDMGEPVRIRDLAARMVAAAGLTLRGPDNPRGDIAIEITGLRPGEKLHEELLVSGEPQPTAHPRILRLHESEPSARRLSSALLALRAALGSGDSAAAVAAARAGLGDGPVPSPPAMALALARPLAPAALPEPGHPLPAASAPSRTEPEALAESIRGPPVPGDV